MNELPFANSERSRRKHQNTQNTFREWQRSNAGPGIEQWLADLHKTKSDPASAVSGEVTWFDAIHFIASRLVNDFDKNWRQGIYYEGITRFRVFGNHEHFWDIIESQFEMNGVVTANYDILIEQALHLEKGKHRTSPRCYYGGLQRDQVVKVITDLRGKERKYRLVELGQEFPLYKLHGSLNWAYEPGSPTLRIHDHVGPAFRSDESFGEVAIVPPMSEKEMPVEFSQIWNEASKVLCASSRWIVCGFSFDPRDQALHDFLEKTLRQRLSPPEIIIIDPDEAVVTDRVVALGVDRGRVQGFSSIREFAAATA